MIEACIFGALIPNFHLALIKAAFACRAGYAAVGHNLCTPVETLPLTMLRIMRGWRLPSSRQRRQNAQRAGLGKGP